jgi:hypothetical protein
MNTDQPLDQIAARLGELRSERNALASTRTREDVRGLAENWLAAALAQANGAGADRLRIGAICLCRVLSSARRGDMVTLCG